MQEEECITDKKQFLRKAALCHFYNMGDLLDLSSNSRSFSLWWQSDKGIRI